MKYLLAVTCLALLPATEGLAAPGFSWFHTRPKPVLLDDAQNTSTPPTRVQWHGTAAYPRSGRLYFNDAVDQHRSKMTTTVTRGWQDGSVPKPNASAASKPKR
jgi:hypothetical protein